MFRKIESNMREDILYINSSPIEAKIVVLTNKRGLKIKVIKDSVILYDMLG